ncbi:MAG: transposase family protein, partial [Acetobacteraceae bacterium]|nr:transposase family protein [Acetobacteraceae bacterium]
MERFAACFAELEDPREDNARHALNEILVIALCAILCGAEDCSDMALFGRAKEPFLRQFLQLRHGIPSH